MSEMMVLLSAMNVQPVEIQELNNPIEERTFLALFLGIKWAFVVLGASIVTSIFVSSWFLLVGIVLTIGLILSDGRVVSYCTKQITKLLDSKYDEIETISADLKSQLDKQYWQLLSQAMDIYREIKVAIHERDGIVVESFDDVFPAIQALMEKILHLTKKAQMIDNGLRCHDDVDHTRKVLAHYQQKIEQDSADDFIKSEWVRTRDSLVKQLKSQEEIQRGREFVQSKLTNIVSSLREVHLSIIRSSFSDIQEGADDLSGVFQRVMNLSEAIDDTVETLERITYQRVE
jgi:hypothetical protein